MVNQTDLFSCLLPWISLLVTLFITWLFYKEVLCALHDKYKIRRLIKKKQREREHAFRKMEVGRYGQIDAKAERILQLTETQLLDELQKKKLSSTEVLDAFIAKALKTTLEYNCITEFIPQAHIWAAKLDEMKGVKGPLHGLPISVKDNCNVEGTDSTLGFAKNLYKPADENAVLIQVLLDLGAIPFCKTNIPQTLFCYGGGNPIFGETLNCLNPKLSPGGSSIGEACLVGNHRSHLGIGSDVGGSVRIPSHHCGTIGFKPTRSRLSAVGFKTSIPGVVGLYGSPGLIARNVDMISTAFKAIITSGKQNVYDSLTIPIPWNEQLFTMKRPLRIGYFTNLSYFPLLGDTENVVMSAKVALEKTGHILLPFEMPDSYEIMRLLAEFAYADNGKNILKIWKDEPIAQAAISHYITCRIPHCIRKLLACILNFKFFPWHSKRVATFWRGGATKSEDLWKCMATRAKLLQQITTQWRKLELDLLLSPTFPFPALPIKYSGKLKLAIAYTVPWNIFDFPCGNVKFGIESGKLIDQYDNEGDLLLRWAQEGIKESIGMPISVQLIALPFKEELLLHGMKEVEMLSQERKQM